ncbi:MAG: hypothetical protein LBJ72_11620 [Dysgonamonadaceae bacterium]|jgi:hypothetical protein|nr:hypothetical protein [Dysgonamonadaceae bacterium]
MKRLKYTGMILATAFFIASCEKHEIEFDSRPADNVALVQFHNEIPVPSGTAYNFLKVELNGVDVTHGNVVTLSSWNTIPTQLGRYYSTNPGTATIKLYQGTAMKLAYEQTVTLQAGKKQGLILYDYNQPPLVVEEPDNYLPDRTSFDTDTVEYVRFFNLMREDPNVASDLKLQYQYQYTLHPLYTLEDEAAGTIPDDKNVGDATNDATVSAWLNLGEPVAFGEDTGWQLVPIKKTAYVSQGSARIDYRIKVTQGGVVGTTMTEGDNLLICYDRSSARIVTGYTDYWTGTNSTVGRRYYHFFSGYRNVTPGVDIVLFFEK